jgi:hypothetical protein
MIYVTVNYHVYSFTTIRRRDILVLPKYIGPHFGSSDQVCKSCTHPSSRDNRRSCHTECNILADGCHQKTHLWMVCDCSRVLLCLVHIVEIETHHKVLVLEDRWDQRYYHRHLALANKGPLKASSEYSTLQRDQS